MYVEHLHNPSRMGFGWGFACGKNANANAQGKGELLIRKVIILLLHRRDNCDLVGWRGYDNRLLPMLTGFGILINGFVFQLEFKCVGDFTNRIQNAKMSLKFIFY